MSITSGLRRRAAGLAMATVATVVLSACAPSFDPAAIPAPGRPGTGDGYPLQIEFDNVLNLPGGASVMLNGAPAGKLDKLELGRDAAVASVTILDGVQIPRTATVSLIQDTLLGDVYIAINAPTDTRSDSYRPRETVPKRQTKPVAAVEDVLVDLAAFLGGGSLMDLQSTFATILTELPSDPAQLRTTMATVSRTVNDVAAQNDSVESLIGDLSALSGSAVEHQQAITDLLSNSDRTFLGSGVKVAAYTEKIFTEFGQLLATFKNTTPAIDSATGFVDGVLNPLLVPATGRPSNVELLEKLLRDKLIPFLRSGSRVDVRSVTNGPSDPQTARQLVANLRMIGALG